MGTKKSPGKFDCYDKALADEPMFILLARDPSAPALIRRWAHVRNEEILLGNRPAEDRAMVDEALQCAEDMVSWRNAHANQWRKNSVWEEAERIKFEQLRPGDMVVLGPGFRCIKEYSERVVHSKNNTLMIDCDKGDHYLDANKDDEGFLIRVRRTEKGPMHENSQTGKGGQATPVAGEESHTTEG